ncbi:MAG: late competence development ComFB family protein [Spirochaetota bacterium]|jgi:competence protein ComFB|nr:late competence development ComFB family protein [Spirochaetota bacterium]
MAFKDEYNFSNLVNEMENLIINETEQQLNLEENSDICRCEDCILDIVAYALNQVPASYRCTYSGRLYAQALYVEEKKYAIYRNAVKVAIDKVRKNPSHS